MTFDAALDVEVRFAVPPANVVNNVPLVVIADVEPSVTDVPDVALELSVTLLLPDANVITLLEPPIVMFVPDVALPVIETVPIFNVAAVPDVPSNVTDVPCSVKLPTV